MESNTQEELIKQRGNFSTEQAGGQNNLAGFVSPEVCSHCNDDLLLGNTVVGNDPQNQAISGDANSNRQECLSGVPESTDRHGLV
ncbi:MAG: hypothetical protein PHI97_18955 [Desulfobulbus sp.]|nr:hypothetical protein [Desulfobulbus sp.]